MPPYPAPPPAPSRIYEKPRNNRPSNDLRPDNEKLIQFYIDKEFQKVWIYLPQPVKRSAVCDEMLDKSDESLYWDAVELHVAVLEQIHKNDQDAANQSILHEIKKATTNGLNAGIKYVNDLAGRPPFNGQKVDGYLLLEWEWKAALTHRKMAKVYLGYSPYCTGSSDWRTKPAYEGIYYFDTDRDVHFIHDVVGWASFSDPCNSDIQSRLAIIEEVREEDDANMNQETPA
ncbi:hypothetical protein V500_00747 [Pseudogymnoascus sp. VKM F-4518 (FW-2643)]|nr:hypothetical protein V500_00747 [Pseudogymnoascus sp. VKM F-4518 (FW-2643)]